VKLNLFPAIEVFGVTLRKEKSKSRVHATREHSTFTSLRYRLIAKPFDNKEQSKMLFSKILNCAFQHVIFL